MGDAGIEESNDFNPNMRRARGGFGNTAAGNFGGNVSSFGQSNPFGGGFGAGTQAFGGRGFRGSNAMKNQFGVMRGIPEERGQGDKKPDNEKGAPLRETSEGKVS